MKVILTQDVRGQGKKGQLIDAAEGYARNFLLPRKLAVLATADAINTMNLKEKARRAEEAANRQAAVEMGGKLKNVTVKLTAKGGKGGQALRCYHEQGNFRGPCEPVPARRAQAEDRARRAHQGLRHLRGQGQARLRSERRVLRQRERGVRRKITQLRRSSRGRYLLPADAFIRSRPSSPCSARCSSTQTASRT